jgi:hypothetical protein
MPAPTSNAVQTSILSQQAYNLCLFGNSMSAQNTYYASFRASGIPPVTTQLRLWRLAMPQLQCFASFLSQFGGTNPVLKDMGNGKLTQSLITISRAILVIHFVRHVPVSRCYSQLLWHFPVRPANIYEAFNERILHIVRPQAERIFGTLNPNILDHHCW